MGALVNLFAGSELDTGIDPLGLQQLNTYWEQTRLLYSPFESDLRSPASDVYLNEIPGGQYTNLKYQATELGLSGVGKWEQIKKAYAEANRVLGDIVKVGGPVRVWKEGGPLSRLRVCVCTFSCTSFKFLPVCACVGFCANLRACLDSAVESLERLFLSHLSTCFYP